VRVTGSDWSANRQSASPPFQRCNDERRARGAYPFTTIDPSVGEAYARVDCAAPEFDEVHPNVGYCTDGTRFVPTKLVDVAGLIPGTRGQRPGQPVPLRPQRNRRARPRRRLFRQNGRRGRSDGGSRSAGRYRLPRGGTRPVVSGRPRRGSLDTRRAIPQRTTPSRRNSPSR